MRFGLTGCHGGLDGLALDEQTELIQEAEHLGYESIWLNEEHFQAGGRFCLSPGTHASYLAARTERLRLGFSVLLVPLHDPLRLAEEIASLDQLSGGRVEVGISRGGNERYHHAFGIEYAQRTTRYLEALACMHAFWAGDGPVDFAGEHFTYNAVEMTPKPVQRPHPPIHVGARDPDSVRRAAISGYALLEGPVQSLEYSLLDVQAYRSGAASVGRVVDPNALTFGRVVFLAEDDARARAQALATPRRLVVVLLVLAPRLVLYISMFVGRFGVAPAGVLQILGSRVLPFVSASADASTTVVLDVRLHRVPLARLVGAGLSVSGAAFQDRFRNALVSPDILGVSAAAGFGAALAIPLSAIAH
jgi:alkanesulfonate monooxygenase SsuD/methylene tetrahydromethanopterin reductase-like flavin-dependent oxidoreductase (luciferase family)